MNPIAPLLLALALQDDPGLDAMIVQLDDEDIRRREEAVTTLCEYGERAVDALRLATTRDSLEGRLRAQEALDRIERNARIRRVLTEPEMVDLRCQDRPLEEILGEFSRTSGVATTLGLGLGGRRVSLTKGAMTPLEALDAVCAQAGCEWSYRSPRVVEIRDGRGPGTPSSYAGRFRFTLTHLEKFQSMCGDVPSDTLCLRVRADHEQGVSPVMPPEIVVERIVDDAGRVIIPDGQVPPWVTAPFHLEDTPADDDHSFRSAPLLVPDLPPGVRRLAGISGYAVYEFALAATSIEVPNIDTMAWVQQGSLEIGVFAPQAGAVEVRIQSTDGTPLGRGALEIAGIRIIDTDGVEHRASARTTTVTDHSTPEASCLHYVILFDEYGQSHARSATLPLVTERYEKRVPFTFVDVPLP